MTVTVARVTSPRDPRTAQRIPYAEASRVLLRDSILDGMRELLLTRDWSSITLSDVAKAAGISRQTIYNEFGSRQGLAQGYALRLADRLVDQISDAIGGNVGDIYAAFLQGFRDFFVGPSRVLEFHGAIPTLLFPIYVASTFFVHARSLSIMRYEGNLSMQRSIKAIMWDVGFPPVPTVTLI